MLKLPLYQQILLAIALPVLLKLLAGIFSFSFDQTTVVLGVNLHDVFAFIGAMFLNGLKMVVVPLVLASIICAVSGIAGQRDLGRLGGKSLLFYVFSSFAAIMVGLFFVNLIAPGIVDGEPAKDLLALSDDAAVQSKLALVEGRGTGDIAAVFLRMLPPNIVAAAADGQMLGLITFGILFGYFMMQVAKEKRSVLEDFWQGVFETMMLITMFVMKFAPLGVLGLIGKTVMATGFAGLEPMLVFMFCVIAALAAHMFITMPLILRYVAKVNPIKHYQAMAPALLTAFSTASSSGTLPLTMECVEKNAKVSNKTAGFVLPLGATVNMDGTALYECVAAMFIAQAYGLDLSLTTQFTIVMVALLTSVGVAGIPAASLVAITIILAAIGLPAEGIGLLLLTDRLLDMMRTAVNVWGDSCCAVVVAKSEGEEQVLKD
ncbi:dicarboxylate/amino acid:cation symporter [Agaribacterium haliotis]|uniref:dicarboxylate/amino acid:cation symporter n=1 Tax=Agaribacterium haliotis TaxID=2013869 RepID=UPI000BB578DC|nr:dicarboxylate/amino acid:cation symporter [Agaribacterium haliotis]